MTDDLRTTETTAAPDAASNAAQQAAEPAPQADTPLAAPLSPAPEASGKDINADIAKILQEVKLPEQRAQKPARVIENQAPALGELPTFQGPPATPAPDIPKVIVPPAAGNAAPQETEAVAEPIQSLHTMKNDLQDVVRDRKISAVRAAAIEQDRPERPYPLIVEPRRKSRTGLIIVSIILLLLLGGAALYAVQLLTQPAAPTTPTSSVSAVFAENQISLSLDNETPSGLRATLAGMLAQFSAPAGSITQVIPTVAASGTSPVQEEPATLAQFFTALGANPPPQLMRAVSDQFFFGMHMANEPSPVFIIPVLSYDDAFAGMLAWEPTIDSDLSALFKQVPAVTANPQGGLPITRQFKDLVMQNYDVRALEDDSGNIVLYYSFPTQDLLIISASPYTFTEVLSRLQAERKL